MRPFIKSIRVNKVLHLQDFEINLGEAPKHLLITGANGSGKTQLLKAMVEHLQLVGNDQTLRHLGLDEEIKTIQKTAENTSNESTKASWLQMLDSVKSQKESFFGKVRIIFSDVSSVIKGYAQGDFVIAYYQTFRNPKFEEVHSIEKPDLTRPSDISRNKVGQFLKFLADNKVQAALARNEGKNQDAENINNWFNSFRDVLRNLFSDSKLELDFDYTDYSFYINSSDKRFKFTQLSAGYAAALDIVADLILRMQKPGSLVRAYDKPGIVLIDEPETHLHLGLQRQIMPILTKLFPNIQFVVATHSPFILSSLSDAVAFDLEHRKALEDLTEYSYNALAEGYFGVPTESGVLTERLDRMETLVSKEFLNDVERAELEKLFAEFGTLSEAAAPAVKGRFMELKRRYRLKG